MAEEKLIEDLPASTRWMPANLLARLRAAGWSMVTTLAGCAAVGYVIWRILTAYVLPVSSQAVIAGRVHVMRAPIDGVLSFSDLHLGATLSSGQSAGVIRNPWTSDLFVRELADKLELSEAATVALEPQVARLEEFSEGLRRGANLFQLRHVDQLKALLGEAEARLEADRAQSDLAASQIDRAGALLKEGVVSQEQHAERERDLAVARQQATAAEQSLQGLRARLQAAQQGISIDSSGVGSDRPYSRQRLDEVTLELMRLRQRIEEEQKKQRTLKDQLARARARFQELSEVTLKVDSRVRAWKLMASDGEYVSRGQPLVTLLRCDDLFVVAAVRERIFNKLEIGSPARFKADDGSVYQGSVVQLDGLTRMHEEETVVAPGMVGQRDPIPTSADPYRVTIALPGLAARQAPTCGVGRSGEVVFD